MPLKNPATEKLAVTIIENLKKRNMEGFYCATASEAVEKALSLMPENSSITWGGSETLKESGLMNAIHEKNYRLIDRSSAKTAEESRAIYGEMVCADFFLTSTNALTINGELVNIDGHSNRVACLCCGPQNVIVLAGINKLVPDVESGFQRVRNIAAPPNAVRLSRNTPCAQTGKCADCFSPDCICSQIVVTRRSSIPNRIKVILIGEALGF